MQRKLEERSDSVAEKRGLAEEDSSKALSQADSRTHSDNEVVGAKGCMQAAVVVRDPSLLFLYIRLYVLHFIAEQS